jgi:uncharacterized membrane protein YgaE (UPF0421/DUF939 family)
MPHLRRSSATSALRRGAAFGSTALDLSAKLSRDEARRRSSALRSKAYLIGQCALSAAVAYAIARYVFDVAVPLFAPVAAMVTLGMTHGQRLRRALEITVGVAVGVFVGELVVSWAGMGWWQVALIVGVSMTLAALLDVGPLLITQAGIQGLIVALLAADSTLAFGRWFEALIGCTVGLVFASVVPTSTVLRPRARAISLVRDVSDVLSRTAAAMDEQDVESIEKALVDARGTETALAALRGATADSREILRLTPLSRERRAAIATVSALLEPLDRAIRNLRVLNRRAAVSLQTGEHTPPAYVEAVAHLAVATELVVHHIENGRPPGGLRPALLAIARETAARAPGASLSAEVIRAQVRSMLVDYLMIVGDSFEEAQRQVRSPRAD